MSNKKYWQNFGDLTESERFQQDSQKEFQEELLPLAELDGKGILDAATPRRDFLKYLGFSTAAAALAASCETPVKKSVPYLQKPDNVIPGVANFYASTFVSGGDAIPVVVKQRDGRPIKIEGNELSSITKGGTNALAQASVLDLYDPTRLRHPLQKNGAEFKEVTSFGAFDKLVGAAMAGVAGRAVVLLTSTVNSPSTLQIISEFLAKYPGSRHVQYDAVSHSGMLLANEMSYGKRALPSYRFDKAKTIVSLGADFLGTWLSPVEFNRQYAATKRVTSKTPQLSRHIQFESMMSLTGSNADDRFTHKPSQTGAVALALLSKLGGGVTAPALDAKLAKGIDTAAAALMASKGAGLVVCGSNDVNVQVVVNAINDAIGANGSTISWSNTNNTRKGIDTDMAKLVADMNGGAVGAVLVYDCNPVYSYTDAKSLVSGLAKTPVTVSFNGTMDETTEQCKYVLPSHHWLESWGDAEPKSGHISLIQPVINPLFKTRPFQESLLKLAGNPSNYETYYKTYWATKAGSAANWDKALQDGVIEPGGVQAAVTAMTAASDSLPAPTPVVTPAPVSAGAAFSSSSLGAAAGKITAGKSGPAEVVLYQKVSMGNGSQANNPWLQELPDPISKVTWDNYAMVSPAMAKKLFALDVVTNQRHADSYEVTPEKPVLKITVNGRSLELPALIIPGVDDSTVAVALGYGRQSVATDNDVLLDRTGRAAAGAGRNAYPLVTFDGTTLQYNTTATVEKTGTTYPLAQTQVHGFTEGRPVIYETNLASYIANPKGVLAEANHERTMLIPEGKNDFRTDGTLYPDFIKPGVKWGMSIDLNTCTGCSACVVACTAENNVSVVGKIQVQRAHEMHWLRIDRYFTGDLQNPDVVFQPMLCQHCDNAPCENVCPVAATNHSSEGLNQMTYNRCIGTRYCANNCPYKVRRFNWLDYNGSDSFKNNQKPLIGSDMNEVVNQMNDDLTRMVLNPDVTVRSRGVIEKCSFCVQRLQDRKLEAKKQQDPTLVRNVNTACMQACPTHAISFGNVNDTKSEVSMARADESRNFYVLEQLHVLPNVSYLAKIRNTDRQIGHHEELHLGETKEDDEKPAAHEQSQPAH